MAEPKTERDMQWIDPATGERGTVKVVQDPNPSTGPCRSCGVVFTYDPAQRMIDSMRQANHPEACLLFQRLLEIEQGASSWR